MASGRGTTTVDSDADEHSKLRAELRVMLKEALEAQAGKEDRAVSAFVQRKCDELYGPTVRFRRSARSNAAPPRWSPHAG